MTAPLAVGLTVLEGISGMVLMGASLPPSGSLETASWIGILTAVLVGLSSAVHLVKVRKRNRNREASEGKRLYAKRAMAPRASKTGPPNPVPSPT